MKKMVRGKFPDDKRDRMLTKGRIVKIEPMFPPASQRVWQLHLFKSNDPRKQSPDCTTNFAGAYRMKGWGKPWTKLGPLSPYRKNSWEPGTPKRKTKGE